MDVEKIVDTAFTKIEERIIERVIDGYWIKEVNDSLNQILKCIICSAENLENVVKNLMEEVKLYIFYQMGTRKINTSGCQDKIDQLPKNINFGNTNVNKTQGFNYKAYLNVTDAENEVHCDQKPQSSDEKNETPLNWDRKQNVILLRHFTKP